MKKTAAVTMLITLLVLLTGHVMASPISSYDTCRHDCRVTTGDYSLILPEIGAVFNVVEQPSLDNTLTGEYVDDGQTIIYQAKARNRYGNIILVTVLQRENATEHFGDLGIDQFSIVAYASTADMVGTRFQALIWVDYIDPENDRHIAVVIESSSKNLENYSEQFWDSAVSLR